MKINKPFNQLHKEEYLYYIENHKQYSDFNTLGLYRSLLENQMLTLNELLEIREFAHSYFQKTFDFLQLKDPRTYMKVVTLGEDLTPQERQVLWESVRDNQQKILKEKRFGHRNFGTYSKHECGLPYCTLDGLMVKQNSPLGRDGICFESDENKDEKENKSKRLQKEKRNFKQNKNRFED